MPSRRKSKSSAPAQKLVQRRVVRRAARAGVEWASASDARLLDMRLCDLGLAIEGTWLEKPIETLHRELERRELLVRPHFWLSEEWFCPDGVPGIAIPFYLAHPRLIRLEREQMLEAEGSTLSWCMKLMRHEAGHAIQNAYRLHRRRAWREVFGRSSKTYPDFYRPEPASRDYVVHLYNWYAQSHPAEDFAETFAVWLRPGSRWREQYRGWPALKKLRCVHELMQELAGVRPPVTSRRQVDPLSRITKTLREHYAEKRARYGTSFPMFYDRGLHKIFPAKRGSRGQLAAVFLRRHRDEIRHMVAPWSGDYGYIVDEVYREIEGRARQLGLRVTRPAKVTERDLALFLTAHTMRYMFTRREHRPL